MSKYNSFSGTKTGRQFVVVFLFGFVNKEGLGDLKTRTKRCTECKCQKLRL